MLLGILIFFWLLIAGIVACFEFGSIGMKLLASIFWPIALVCIVGWLVIWTLGGQKGMR